MQGGLCIDNRMQYFPDQDFLHVLIREGAVRLLAEILANMAVGNAVTLIPVHAELTTKQAADIPGVYRPFLIRLLKDGVIPFCTVGTHRRVFFEDVQASRNQVIEVRGSVIHCYRTAT